ncbi:MAG: fibrillarin-like rRNA/tRNA 2'-O-methyltransferase [Candidatus Aenigmatarchaeota archaeon]
MPKVKPLKFAGVFLVDNKIATINLIPGKSVYGEKLIKMGKKEYREWIPFRSKPAAAIKKGLKTFPIKRGDKILYVGASFGTTCSHFSDIIGKDGIIYAIEISPRCMRELITLSEVRKNIVPVLADARKPQDYTWIEPVDIVYQDVAIPDQSEVLIRNCQAFLKPKGFAMIAIKSRSIDVTVTPFEVYRREIRKLGKHFKIAETVQLDPLEKDHLFALMQPKP